MIEVPGHEPVIDVGLLYAEEITLVISGIYLLSEEPKTEILTFTLGNGGITLNGNLITSSNIKLTPEKESGFTVKNVKFGINFHWERHEDMYFEGEILIKKSGEQMQLINRILIEDYLKSVISSEMSAKASVEFLKAHAVMSRSWLLAQFMPKERSKMLQSDEPDSLIRWYDREDHDDFDVCADDHCQRYQGKTKLAKDSDVYKAIENTRGMVLMYGGQVCDARFSKCCGGITESFSSCWEDDDKDYLVPVFDNRLNAVAEIGKNWNWDQFINAHTEAFCNTSDQTILQQVLNEYDQETTDFYRWEEKISAKEIQEFLKKKTGRDLGSIEELEPLERGPSGRIFKLKITGEKGELVIGKELEIRRVLSNSHLLSSAFIVKKVLDDSGSIYFLLKGAGWGHGVGLCQIGAAVMGVKGYSYTEILSHYFKHTTIEKRY